LDFHEDLPLQQVVRRLGIVSLSEKDKARLALKAPTTAPRVVRYSADHLRRVADHGSQRELVFKHTISPDLNEGHGWIKPDRNEVEAAIALHEMVTIV
jgi:hypothetical protein